MYISDEQKKRAIVYARESYTEHGLGCAEAVIAALIRAGILDLDGSYVCFGSGFTGGVGCSGGTWCGPCCYEAPFFEELAQKFTGDDILFVSISMDEDKEKWLA